LTIIGSIVPFSASIYALQNLPAHISCGNSYIILIAAVFSDLSFFGVPLPIAIAITGVIPLCRLYLVNT
jgi:hypothetical protein